MVSPKPDKKKPSQKPVLLAGLLACLLLPSCASSPWAKDLERSLAADPSLEDGSLFGGASPAEGSSPQASPSPTEAQLPFNFPTEIPRYPGAELLSVSTPDRASTNFSTGAGITQTQWTTSDAAEQVQQFYRNQFQAEGWQIGSSSSEATADSSIITATRDGLQVTVSTDTTDSGASPASPASPSSSASPASPASPISRSTEFTLEYEFSDTETIAQSPAAGASNTPANSATTAPQPGDPAFIGPVPPANWGTSTASTGSQGSPAPATVAAADSQTFSDLTQAPAELQPYLTDLATLGALPLQANTATSDNATGGNLQPNQAITRREYARWLVATNNLIYTDQPSRQIRLAVASDQAVFQDVPSRDPDFGVIQGLANAGLIPSPLSGDATVVTFRPDAPLTREELVAWKVPIDLRQALPNATVEAVQQTWGFQDAARIEPEALQAVLADFQNGDSANIRRAFGYTTLFQPDKPVTRAEAAAALWFFGYQGDGRSAKDALSANPAQSPQLPQ